MSSPSILIDNGESDYLEFSDDRSHKFYEVTLIDLTVTVRYGRVGSQGQISSNTYPTFEGWAGGDTGGWFGKVNSRNSKIGHSLPRRQDASLDRLAQPLRHWNA